MAIENSNFYLAPLAFDARTGRPCDADSQLAWAKESRQQSLAYLRLQPAFPYIQDGLDLINGNYAKVSNTALSNAKTELTVRNTKELVASQSNLRIIPAIMSDVQEYADQTVLLGKAFMFWQQKTFADRVARSAWQSAAACGTGYISIGYDPDYYALGQGEICLRSHGPTDVLPLGLPHDHNLQKAYSITLKIPTPYHQAIRMFPDYRDKIRPTSDSLQSHGVVMPARYTSPILNRFGPGVTKESEHRPWAMVDLYYSFIDDRTVNRTGKTALMGDPGTSWEYRVPSIGDFIPVAQDIDGKWHYKQAEERDCLYYPHRRVMVSTDDCVLTPDPYRQVNHGWHGKVPIVQFRADDWPWTFLGFPLSKAGMLLEKANIELLRGMVDMMNVRLSPPTGYDRNTMARSLAETINLRVPNQRVGMDYTLGGDQLRPLIPVEYLTVPNNIPEFMTQNEQRITHQMGVADAMALTRVRQLPSADNTEQLLEALGPLVKDQSRNMEFSITSLGDMWIPLVFQWWSAGKRLQIFGDDGLLTEDLDFAPGKMVPQQLPTLPPYSSYFERAQKHARNFHYSIEPYSLHELNSITRKMAFLQLQRSGFPLSWWTLAKVWDVKNFGPKPKDTDPNSPNYGKEFQTELELWISQMEIMARFGAAMQGQQPGQGFGGGRPPSSQQPPSMEVKSDGRSTIRESKR